MFVLLKHRSPEKPSDVCMRIPPLFSKVETEFTSARLCETLLNTLGFGSSVEQEKGATALRFHTIASKFNGSFACLLKFHTLWK